MTIYKAGLLTTVFSHIISTIRKEYLNKIYIFYASRRIEEEKPISKTIIPSLYYRKRVTKHLDLQKRGLTPYTHSEWEKIIEIIRSEGFGDLTVSKLSFVVDNSNLREMIEESLGKKIAPTKFVILFESSTRSAKESYIKRDLLNVMREYAEKLGLKYATLELSGIYTLQDWRGARKFNLLTTKKINVEKEVVKEIIETIFKPSIKIKGQDIKVRFIKWYELGEGRVLKLKGFEKV